MATDLDTAVTYFFRIWYSLKAMVGSRCYKSGLRVDLKNFAYVGYEQHYPCQIHNMKANYEY